MIHSTISDSTATRGGAIYVESGALLTVINSTFSQNDATLAGDAIVNAGTVSLFSSTVARNGNVLSNSTQSVQNLPGARFFLHNTIIADNTSISDTTGDFVSHGNNVIGNAIASTGLLTASVMRDQVGGQYGAPVISNVVGPLGKQGGRTRTNVPLNNSLAIDRGSSYGVGLTDQRGADRKLDGPDTGALLDPFAQVDVGASEFGTYFVNVAYDALDTSATITDGIVDADNGVSDVQISLRGAVRELSAMAGWNGQVSDSIHNRFEGVIRFENSLNEVVVNRVGTNEQSSLTGDLDVWGNLRIVGNDVPITVTADWMTSNGQAGIGPQYFALGDRAFQVFPSGKLSLEKLKLAGFRSPLETPTDSGNGGAILNDGGDLTLRQTEVFFPNFHPTLSNGKMSAVNGGAIYSRGGTVEIIGSKLGLPTTDQPDPQFTNSMSNLAVNGGGIFLESGRLLIDQQSTLSNNYAQFRGGAIYAQSGSVVIDGQSVLERNLAGKAGGSIYIEPTSNVTIQGASNIDNNTNRLSLVAEGVAIYNLGTLTMKAGATLSKHSLFGGSGLYNDGQAILDHTEIAFNGHTADSAILHNLPNGRLTITHSTYSNTFGTVPDSGSIRNDQGWVHIDDVRFTNNSNASRETGLIANIGIDANMVINNSRFEQNYVSVEGGAPLVYNQSGDLDIQSSIFEYNYNIAGTYATATAIRNLGINELINSESMTLAVLSAQVDTNQKKIFVNDVTPLIQLPLPIHLLMGDERVKVTAIDTFLDALIVERSQSTKHGASEKIQLYVDETQENIVVTDPVKYQQYNLPLDIAIGNEVMTVTKSEGNLLTVIRGRNNTRAAEHIYPFDVWAVSGGLKMTNVVIADNHAPGQLYPAGSEMVYNWVHPHAPATILESSTFFNNSRFPAEIYNEHSESMTDNIFANSGDVRTYRGSILALPLFNRAPFPAIASRADGSWHDLSPSMVIENTAFGSQPATQGKNPPAVRGSFQSKGGNFIDEAEVDRFETLNQLSATETTIFINQPDFILPSFPYLAQIGHTHDKQWQREYVMVTAAEKVTEGNYKNGIKLTVQRGAGGTPAIIHPYNSIVVWSTNGFWDPTDRYGLPTYEAYTTQRIRLTNAVAASQLTLMVDDPTGFPPVPFNARIVGNPTNAQQYNSEGIPEALPTHEDVTVTAVNGYQLTVVRHENSTVALEFAANSFLEFYTAVETRIDPKLTRYTPVGETDSVIIPLPNSPLLNTAINSGFSAKYATLSSNLGANNFAVSANVVMSIGAAYATTTVNYTLVEDTQIQVSSVSAMPAVPFILKIDNELLDVTAVNTFTNRLTVKRGAYGTKAYDIPSGSSAYFGKPVSASPTDKRFLVENANKLPQPPFALATAMKSFALKPSIASTISLMCREPFKTLRRSLTRWRRASNVVRPNSIRHNSISNLQVR